VEETIRRLSCVQARLDHGGPGVKRSGALEDAFDRALDRLRRTIGLNVR
jgi:hypothetical protein